MLTSGITNDFFLILFIVGNFQFIDATDEAKIAFHHFNGQAGKKYYVEILGSGAAFFDYDNDGDLDLYFVNGSILNDNVGHVGHVGNNNNNNNNNNALYRNNGDETFTEVTAQAGVGDTGYGVGCAVGDYDNDGFVDLYITNFGANVLYHNNGDGTLTDVTEFAQVGDSLWGASCAFLDYDNDSDLDLYVTNYVDFQLDRNIRCTYKEIHTYCGPDSFEGVPDVLYQNNGNGTFTDVTKPAGVYEPQGRGLGVTCGDYDNDGDVDIFIANDQTPNFLFQNNGNGTFTELGILAGVAFDGRGMTLNGMGTSFGDYDNDGYLDIVVTNFQDQVYTLYHNDGDGLFTEVSFAGGIGEGTLPYLGWGVDFADFDNDGYQDLFFANGHFQDNIRLFDPIGSYEQPNQVYLNHRDGTFREVSSNIGPGLLLRQVSRGAAFGDYDNDGDVDILVTNLAQRATLLKNQGGNRNSWLAIMTIGTKSNRDGIGTTIKVKTGDIVQTKTVKSGSSYLSASDFRILFGLGSYQKVELLEIRWPSGLVEKFKDVEAGQMLIVVEGNGVK